MQTYKSIILNMPAASRQAACAQRYSRDTAFKPRKTLSPKRDPEVDMVEKYQVWGQQISQQLQPSPGSATAVAAGCPT